jgi:hypothetical protein
MEKPNSKHDNKAIDEALKKLNNIQSNRDTLFYKKFIKPFTDELGETLFFEFLKSGIRDIIDMKRLVDRSDYRDYENPLQMVWNFCKVRFLLRTHNKIIDRYQNYATRDQRFATKVNALKKRIDIVTNYIDDKFKSIGGLYNTILREELRFFDS